MTTYTKSGDDGTTSLCGGKRVIKSGLDIEAYGAIDELSSFIGLVMAKTSHRQTKELLTQIQKDLSQMVVILSSAISSLKQKDHLETQVEKFEQIVDNLEKKLPPLNRFILPQGTEISCWFHILRTICRRAERNVVRYLEKIKIENLKLKIIIIYFNRLSDLFFILSRKHNKQKEILL